MAIILSDGQAGVSTSDHKAISGVAWSAVFAGSLVAIATTLILLALGAGLGFAAASPWPGSGATAASFAIGAGIWLIVTQWLSSALGGYITGRLRSHWHGTHIREVFFRDTANGLLAWALSSVIIAAIALGVGAATVNAATAATKSVASATDILLRSDKSVGGGAPEFRDEIIRLLEKNGPLSAADRDYVARQIAMRAGISPAQAQLRVETATASIRETADKARKASSAVGFFTALSMLIGAFIACVAAAYGGGIRDKDQKHLSAER